MRIPENLDADIDRLPFETDLDAMRDGFTLRAHMPRHAGNDVREGDIMTTVSIPVQEENGVDVVLRQI